MCVTHNLITPPNTSGKVQKFIMEGKLIFSPVEVKIVSLGHNLIKCETIYGQQFSQSLKALTFCNLVYTVFCCFIIFSLPRILYMFSSILFIISGFSDLLKESFTLFTPFNTYQWFCKHPLVGFHFFLYYMTQLLMNLITSKKVIYIQKKKVI